MLIAAVAAGVFLLDFVTKYYVSHHMRVGGSIPVIPHVFYITYIRNAGAAFGLLQHQTVFFIVVTLVVVGMIVGFGRVAARGDAWMSLCLGLLLGGALGNLLDRLLYGTVVDFLNFRVWPIFNLADSAITAGGVIFVVLLFTRGSKAGES